MSPFVEGQENSYRIFEEHGAELYWLAYLLTGDPEKGVAAFTRAMDFEDSANPAFRGFMISWARQLIIAEALVGIRPQLLDSMRRSQMESWSHGPLPSARIGHANVTKAEFERVILELDVFPRCVVLLTIFERLPLAQAALLLNADLELVKKVQVRGLIELTRRIAGQRGSDPAIETRAVSVSNTYWHAALITS